MSDRRKKTRGDGAGAKDMAERRPVPEWLAVKLDVPSDILSGGLRIELRGRHTLLVHGCRKILQYTSEEMRLAMRGCVLCVTGERLICHTYLAGAVGVEGKINGICFLDDPKPSDA